MDLWGCGYVISTCLSSLGQGLGGWADSRVVGTGTLQGVDVSAL